MLDYKCQIRLEHRYIDKNEEKTAEYSWSLWTNELKLARGLYKIIVGCETRIIWIKFMEWSERAMTQRGLKQTASKRAQRRAAMCCTTMFYTWRRMIEERCSLALAVSKICISWRQKALALPFECLILNVNTKSRLELSETKVRKKVSYLLLRSTFNSLLWNAEAEYSLGRKILAWRNRTRNQLICTSLIHWQHFWNGMRLIKNRMVTEQAHQTLKTAFLNWQNWQLRLKRVYLSGLQVSEGEKTIVDLHVFFCYHQFFLWVFGPGSQAEETITPVWFMETLDIGTGA